MHEDKRSLLNNRNDGDPSRECYSVGVGLLRMFEGTKNSSARFIAILERLRGNGIDDGLSNHSRRNTSKAGPLAHTQQHPSAKKTAYKWTFDSFGPVFDTYIDFSDLDTSFLEADDFAQPFSW